MRCGNTEILRSAGCQRDSRIRRGRSSILRNRGGDEGRRTCCSPDWHHHQAGDRSGNGIARIY